MCRIIASVTVASMIATVPAATPPAFAEAFPGDVAAALEGAVERWHDVGEFEGVILVADGDRRWTLAVGQASREWQLPHTVDTRFPIASLTKQITAVLVLQEVESGRLSLDQTLRAAWAEYPGPGGDSITIADLLAHMSGLPEIPIELYVDARPETEDPRWVLETYLGDDLQFEPGTDFTYTNADYHVLGAILTATTGRSFETLVNERVASTLGLSSTAIVRRDFVLARRADDYVTDGERWFRAPSVRWENWQAAGGLASTVADLDRWNMALVNHELLGAEMTERMWTPRELREGTGRYVALGSWVYDRALPESDRALKLVERRGAIGGYAIVNIIQPDARRWVIALANHYTEQLHRMPWGRSLPLDLFMILEGLEPLGPEVSAGDEGASDG
jgi:CubicO group peptidase (beta-lactamase class C family)